MKADVETHGPTEGCPGCQAIVRGSAQKSGHSHQCRLRMQDLIMSDDYGRARIERAAERMQQEAARPAEPTQPGGEVRDAPPQAPPMPPPSAPPEAARGSRDPPPRTLPRPIRPGEQVTPPVGSEAREQLMARARQMRKRAAETHPTIRGLRTRIHQKLNRREAQSDRQTLSQTTHVSQLMETKPRSWLTCLCTAVNLHRTDPRAHWNGEVTNAPELS